jgi:hypothetical protein
VDEGGKTANKGADLLDDGRPVKLASRETKAAVHGDGVGP